MMISDLELIAKARAVAIPMQLTPNSDAGGVGCALVTDKGNIYTGVCIDTPCSMGFCAEANAIGAMITHGEQNIVTLVAVNWVGAIYPPCGRCREFIYQVSSFNANTRILLSKDRSVKLSELLPEHWSLGLQSAPDILG